MKKNIIISIGNKGVSLSLNDKYRVLDRIFIDSFNQSTLPIVNEFFLKHKNCNSYILLDTVAQNYNYKVFPKLNFFDLQSMVTRKFNIEIPKNDLKYKKYLYKNADGKKVYLFVSASTDSPLKEWFNFFETIPNNLLGIYMVPLESVELVRKILMTSQNRKKVKEKGSWTLLTFSNQVSDLRQVAIFNNNIAFTRLITLDSSNIDLLTFLRNDVIRTSEYIKRFDSEFSFNKLSIVNILDQTMKNLVKDLKIENSFILNLTPFEAAQILKLDCPSIRKEDKFSDSLISMFILKNDKNVRFANKKINSFFILIKIFTLLKALIIFISFLTIFGVILLLIADFAYESKIGNLSDILSKNKLDLQNKSKQQFGMDTKEVNTIIDFGTVKDLVDSKYANPNETFLKFYNSQNDYILVENVDWSIVNFNYQSGQRTNLVKIIYDIKIINPDGTTDTLFTKYDSFNSKLKEIYKGSINSISQPNDINFGKKYYIYPVKLDITERK